MFGSVSRGVSRLLVRPAAGPNYQRVVCIHVIPPVYSNFGQGKFSLMINLKSFSTSSQNVNNSSQKKEEQQEQKKEQKEQNWQQSQHQKKRTPFETYSHWLNTYPLLTKAISSAAIVASGDVFAQLVVERSEEFSFRRLLTMGIMGGVIIGPVLHVWYNVLNKVFVAQTTMGAVTRMAADQAIFAPLFIPVIFGFMFGVEGRWDQLPDHLRNHWWDTTLTNWTLWIPAQFITFRFVPASFQVIFVNIVALGWNTYISWKGHVDHEKHLVLEDNGE